MIGGIRQRGLSRERAVAVAKADECVTNVLAFIREAGEQA